MADQATETVVFEETSSEQPTTPVVNMSEAPISNSYTDQLATIRNESGEQKFSNVEAALASISPANTHISHLEEETKLLREELAKRKTAEEIVAQINPARQETVPAEQPVASGLNEARVSELVDLQLKKTEAANSAKQNVTKVKDRLVEHFGDPVKAEAAYAKAAEEAGIGIGFLNDIAAKSPTALFKFMNLDLTSSPLPDKATANSEGLPNLSTQIDNGPKTSMLFGTKTKDLVAYWKALEKEVLLEAS